MRTASRASAGRPVARRLEDDLHAACGRIRAARRSGRLPLELHDLRPGRPDPPHQALPRGARARPEALHPARHPLPDLATRRTGPSAAASTPSASPSFYDETVAEVYELYQRPLTPRRGPLDHLISSPSRCSSASPRRAKRWREAFRDVLATSTRTRTTPSTAAAAPRRGHRTCAQ